MHRRQPELAHISPGFVRYPAVRGPGTAKAEVIATAGDPIRNSTGGSGASLTSSVVLELMTTTCSTARITSLSGFGITAGTGDYLRPSGAASHSTTCSSSKPVASCSAADSIRTLP
jgi:hypothetical protein